MSFRFKFGGEFRQGHLELLRELLGAGGGQETTGADWSLLWCLPRYFKPTDYLRLTPAQSVNRFPGTYELTNKHVLNVNLERLTAQLGPALGARRLAFFPQTFKLPEQHEPWLARAREEPAARWILKPWGLSRGRGVRLVEDLDQVPLDPRWIVQRYIDDPLLIDGYKFHLRLYVLVTSLSPLVVYLHPEGMVEFAAERYRAGSRLSHVTNPNVQLDQGRPASSIRFWRLERLWRHLADAGADTSGLQPAIQDAVALAVVAAQPQLQRKAHAMVPYRGNCFALFGVDLLIDEALRPWLLEFNAPPATMVELAGGGGVVEDGVKRAMLRDTFALLGWTAPRARDPTDPRLRALELDGDLSGGERALLQRLDAEHARRGAYERIFPCGGSRALDTWFSDDRYHHRLLDAWLDARQTGAGDGAEEAAGLGALCSVTASQRPEGAPRVREQQVDGGLVLTLEGEELHLDAGAAYIWFSLRDGMSVVEAAQSLADTFRLSLQVASSRVERSLAQWRGRGLLAQV